MSKKLLKCPILLLAILAIILPLTSEAAFESLAFNARSAGLGDSFTAVSDDNNALIFNPGGLGQIRRAEISTQYTRLYVGLTDSSKIADTALSYTQPLANIGTLGIGYFSRSLSSLYKEELIILGYGKEVRPDLYLGTNIKYATLSTTVTSTALTRSKVSQPSLDLGLLYNHQDWFFIGASISDLNQPNLNMTSQSNKIPYTIRGGINYIINQEGTFMLASDYSRKDKESKVSIGLENWVFPELMGLRLGVINGLGRELLNLTFGFTFEVKNTLSLDYAFIYPLKGIKDTIGSHRVSLSFRFGQEQPGREKEIRRKESDKEYKEFHEKWFEQKPSEKKEPEEEKPKKEEQKEKKKDEFDEFKEKFFKDNE